jgi:hypothetical protein
MSSITQQSSSNEVPDDSLSCYSCEEVYPVERLHELDGHMFCTDCMRDKGYDKCQDCGEWKKESEGHTYRDTFLCDDCYCASYFTCTNCDDIAVFDNSVSTASGDMVCDYCYRHYYFSCEGCDETYHNDNVYSTDDGECYCESCFNERQCECASCGTECSSNELTDIRGIGRVCSDCKPNTEIRNYSFKPEPIFFRTGITEQEIRAEGNVFLGIELEVDCDNICKSLNVLDADDLERLYVKEDGSVPHGFEIVSHPMTIEAHREFNWPNFCKRMYKSGAHGNKPNHGIHVHITKTYMNKVDCMKLSWFFAHHIDQIILLTRRNHCYCESRTTQDIIKDLLRHKQYEESRNEMLNWTPKNTVEFRLPLSTLRGATLLATLELCAASVRFIREHNFIELKDCWNVFMNWCADNGFKHLVGYYLSMAWGNKLEER